ncbi:hypothetical protein XM53_20420 [Roseovarius atlanticus]|nr:hypothetical protein XM53_20420 [Roseovarius atlanticus]
MAAMRTSQTLFPALYPIIFDLTPGCELTETSVKRNIMEILGSGSGVPLMTSKYTFENHGFEEIEASEGMTNAAAYTKECSGGRSDCCTRTCSADATFVASDEDWAKFLDVRGGQIQY